MSGLARDEQLRRVLHDTSRGFTTTMSRYHHSADDVPDGLHIPKWSWHGRVSLIGNPDEFCRAIQLFRLRRFIGLGPDVVGRLGPFRACRTRMG